jgi:glucosamine kinase
MAYFVGIDSGGTKTECWLGNETRVLAVASSGTVKLTRVEESVATQRMRGLLLDVSARSGVDLRFVERTCVGVAGYSIAEVRQWAARVVGATVGGAVEVCGDDEIALEAAFHGGPGILAIGGTGSAVVGRCGDGRKFTAGGWGAAIGDEGSGFWIGREAVREAFQGVDRGVDTGMLEAIRVAWGVPDRDGVVGFANQQPAPDFAALAPVVVARAREGDRIALRVLQNAGDELAELVRAVWVQMRGHGEVMGKVAFTGGILEKVGRVREKMRARILADCVGLRVMETAVNAMEGAMWRARRGRDKG